MRFSYRVYINYFLSRKYFQLGVNHSRILQNNFTFSTLNKVITSYNLSSRFFFLLKLLNLVNIYINTRWIYVVFWRHHFNLFKYLSYINILKSSSDESKFRFIFKLRNFYLVYFQRYNIDIFKPALLSKNRRLRFRLNQQLKIVQFSFFFYFKYFTRKLTLFLKRLTKKTQIFFTFFVKLLMIYKKVHKLPYTKIVSTIVLENLHFYGVNKLKKYPRKKRFLIKQAYAEKKFFI
jgi:hypothetical protein